MKKAYEAPTLVGIHAGPDQCVFTRWRPPR